MHVDVRPALIAYLRRIQELAADMPERTPAEAQAALFAIRKECEAGLAISGE